MAVIAPTIESLVRGTRDLLRDYPQFFEADLGPMAVATIRLPHPLVDGASLQVYSAANPGPDADLNERISLSLVPTSAYTVDQRNGLLKFRDATYLGYHIFVNGYHYEWFLDEDLAFYINYVVDEHLHERVQNAACNNPVTNLDQLPAVELDVISIGGLVRALWALLTEFSTDIDVSTPEGMMIPARQRFSQVWQMLQHWEGIYNDRAKSLNVGLSNIDIFTLRRISRMTNRYVPVYKGREYDDHNPPVRIYPEIPDGLTGHTVDPAVSTGDSASTVEEVGRESADLGYGGWQTLGTSGA